MNSMTSKILKTTSRTFQRRTFFTVITTHQASTQTRSQFWRYRLASLLPFRVNSNYNKTKSKPNVTEQRYHCTLNIGYNCDKPPDTENHHGHDKNQNVKQLFLLFASGFTVAFWILYEKQVKADVETQVQ